MRRDSMTATFTAEKTSAPPSIVRRTAGWPPIGESAMIATATSNRTNSAIHRSQSRGVEYTLGASGGRPYESSPTKSRIAMATRDAGP
jgi:hypothetical protein